MSDKELEEYIKKVEPNFNSDLAKGTIEMSIEYYNLLEERMRRLIDKNEELKLVRSTCLFCPYYTRNKKSIEYLKYLKDSKAKYSLNTGHLRKLIKILEGDNE